MDAETNETLLVHQPGHKPLGLSAKSLNDVDTVWFEGSTNMSPKPAVSPAFGTEILNEVRLAKAGGTGGRQTQQFGPTCSSGYSAKDVCLDHPSAWVSSVQSVGHPKDGPGTDAMVLCSAKPPKRLWQVVMNIHWLETP